MAPNITRNLSATHLSRYVGKGKLLLPSELPIARDILRYGIFLRETSDLNKRNYSVDKLVNDMTLALSAQWKKANCKFLHPVIIKECSIKAKLKYLWETAVKVSLGNAKKSIKDTLIPKMDKLFDILSCKCLIMFCSEYGCDQDCKKQAHIKCTCVRESKIPVIELSFIKSQRDKVGSFAQYYIGGVDTLESTKIKQVIKRKVEYQLQLEKRDKKIKKEEKVNQRIPEDYNCLAQIIQVIIKYVF
jgi:hypothetical protein